MIASGTFYNLMGQLPVRVQNKVRERMSFTDVLRYTMVTQDNFTTVIIESPRGIEGVGVAKKNPTDKTDNMIGFKIAGTRAVKRLLSEITDLSQGGGDGKEERRGSEQE